MDMPDEQQGQAKSVRRDRMYLAAIPFRLSNSENDYVKTAVEYTSINKRFASIDPSYRHKINNISNKTFKFVRLC